VSATGTLLWGELPPPPPDGKPGEIIVHEHGVRFFVDIVHGQKSGLFLDQRENRLRLRRYVAGHTLWNGFAYTGGFSLHAALAGASRVITVDRASPAIVAARRNFVLNGIDPSPHAFLAVDVFQELEAARRRGERYDVVLVDPPSFAPNERSLPAALAAYRELHRLALSLVAPGGILMAASCSSHVDEAAFITTLSSAAEATSRCLRILEVHGQPADHPSPPAFAEGRYLKFVVMAVD
jgi:23S rRNA (cytosine1962-C5)-methyltransferase